MKVFCAALALVGGVVGCSYELKPAKLPATEEVLSRYQTIHIGSQRLTLPTIVLLSSTKHSNLTLDDGSQVPIERVLSQGTNDARVALMDFNIHSYRELQDYDLDSYAYVSTSFCEKLLMNWEKSQCALGLYDGKNSFYPEHFSVVELSYLIGSNAQLFAIAGAGPSGGEAARTLLAKNANEQIMCVEKQKPSCTAVMPIPGNLAAVWATTPEEFEADKKQIRWLMEQYFEKQMVISSNTSVKRDAAPASRLRAPYLER